MRFDQRVIYVTGGGHGIGRATALRLASENGSVTVSDLDGDAAESVAQEIRAKGGAALATACDVTKRTSVDASLARSMDRFGRLDVLVNTAGGDFREPAFEEIDDETWDRKLDLNLKGVMRCIRAALPHLVASGAGANVVSIGSVNGSAAFGGYPYSAAKAGLEIVTKLLAARYGRQGVRFNLINPGTIRTRVWNGRPDDLARLERMYPLGRIGEPGDIAAAVAFLASDDASWITGITLPVDGGVMTGPAAYRGTGGT